MATTNMTISGLDALVFGDGRPFSADSAALTRGSHELPFPSTLFGALSTALLTRKSGQHNYKNENFEVHGPLLANDDQLLFPKPFDGVGPGANGDFTRLRPGVKCEGCDLPPEIERMLQVAGEQGQGQPEKATSDRAFLTQTEMYKWLVDEGNSTTLNGPEFRPAAERRFGVAIAENGTAEEGKLFSAEGRRFGRTLTAESDALDSAVVPNLQWSDIRLAMRISAKNGLQLSDGPKIMHLGGEHRQCVLRMDGKSNWEPPNDVINALAKTDLIRLILATPAQFQYGWLPHWLRGEDVTVPNLGLKAKLVSAAIPRRVAVGGWGLGCLDKGPKPIHWLVPAGSVFFLRIEGDSQANAEKIARDGWLKPVSDSPKFRKKGFGLALWGTWQDDGN